MHERIKDIAVECIVETINDSWVFNDAELEMFAQLIVRECAEVASDCGAYKPEYAIKKHFGVDE